MPMSDKEQMQMVRSWWQEYGFYILFTVIFFLAANFGWRYWSRYKQSHIEQASITYTQMLSAIDKQKKDESKLFGDRLLKNYAKSSYASLAALLLAKDVVQHDDLKAAAENLKFVIKNAPNQTLRQIARIRAARVLIAMKDPRGALNLLTSVDDSTYTAEISEAYGDALMALGEVNEAEKAYRKAKETSKDKKQLPLLQIKLRQF